MDEKDDRQKHLEGDQKVFQEALELEKEYGADMAQELRRQLGD